MNLHVASGVQNLTELDNMCIPGGVLGYKHDGGVRRIFLGLKFSTPVFF